ncbi:uncharacterized protein [Arachis hypogaea]|uniref:uncharacterized protein n=1 Tax=Arachis hypogaea TaxID=3818 RepID=UPI003B22720F
MDKVFRNQIGRNMEIYIDDMVTKTTPGRSHCDDLREIFEQIRAYNMRLNPEKCAFGVQGGKFLGFMLTSRGIEANPEKCDAILNMASPRTMKEVQQLAGRVAALSRFLPAVSSRSYCFFQTISKNKKFEWTDECETAFTELKAILSSPPVKNTTASILRQQSHATNRTKISENRTDGLGTNDNSKKTQALFPKPHNNCKNKPTIKADTDKARTSQMTDQMAQMLADFVFEFTPDEHHCNKAWELHVDGASSREGSGAGVVLKEGDTVIAEQSLNFHFLASNNQAEYEALIAGLKLALNLQVHSLTVHCIIPKDELNPQQFQRRASLYTNIAGELYKHGLSQPLLKCLNNDEAKEVMDEIHEGVCGNHIGGRALAAKITRTGYYWPTMKRIA